jgi:hypothetical protein
MIGFVEKDSFRAWLDRINTWIIDLSSTTECWYNDETLTMRQEDEEYCYLSSIAHRKITKRDMDLSHWWINLCG